MIQLLLVREQSAVQEDVLTASQAVHQLAELLADGAIIGRCNPTEVAIRSYGQTYVFAGPLGEMNLTFRLASDFRELTTAESGKEYNSVTLRGIAAKVRSDSVRREHHNVVIGVVTFLMNASCAQEVVDMAPLSISQAVDCLVAYDQLEGKATVSEIVETLRHA